MLRFPAVNSLTASGLKHLARALKWDASAPFRHLECVPRLFSNWPEGARAGRDGGGLWGRHGLAMADNALGAYCRNHANQIVLRRRRRAGDE